MELKCIIIDDELTARIGLADDIKEINYIKIQALAENAFEAFEYINKISPDVIFLDINMPGLNGIEFLKLIKVKPMVIITTAYPEFALNGFDLGVIDYLLKPISFQRLKIACNKALELHNYRQQFTPGNSSDYFFIKCDGKLEKIMYAAIMYVEAANNYILVHTVSKRFLTYATMKSIEMYLPEDQFVRIHKSFIISKGHIEQVNGNAIIINKTAIPLSRNFKRMFQNLINDKLYKK